jgi:hypothetical protein
MTGGNFIGGKAGPDWIGDSMTGLKLGTTSGGAVRLLDGAGSSAGGVNSG